MYFKMQIILHRLHCYLSLSVCFPHCSHPHLGLLEQATLKQCVVGPNHAGFLLEVILVYTAQDVIIIYLSG